MDITYDWDEKSKWVILPLGAMLSKMVKPGFFPSQLSGSYEYNFLVFLSLSLRVLCSGDVVGGWPFARLVACGMRWRLWLMRLERVAVPDRHLSLQQISP